MADAESPLAQVDHLLQQRAQYEEWLAKLSAAGSKAPEGVRVKVRSDYEGRLDAVLAELRTHASSVEGALSGHREGLAALEARRADIEERLAEAEIRHAVGEFTEDEWSAVGSEAESALDEIGKRAAAEQGEISRLADVLQLIAKPAATPTRRIETQSRQPVAAVEEPQAPAAESHGAPKFVPKTPGAMRAAAPPPRVVPPAGNELDFLKSVTGEQQGRKAAPKKTDSGQMRAISVAPGDSVRAAESEAGESQSTARPSGAINAKTLKCGECGTLNRPTEWYCERCGAELAAL